MRIKEDEKMKNITGKPQVIKAVNQDIILNALKMQPGITQPQLSDVTGISLATVNKTIKAMLIENKVICLGDGDYTGGRRAKRYDINPNIGLVISVYIHEDGCRATLANILGDPIKSEEYLHKKDRTYTDELIGILEDIKKSINAECLEGIAIAVPGTVLGGHICNIPAIPEWEGIDLIELVKGRGFSCKITVENDMKAAAMGVCGKYINGEKESMVFLSVSNTIGASLIIDGRIYSSNKHFSGELAFMAVNGSQGMENGRGSVEVILRKAIEENDRSALIKIIAQLIVNVCCVVDPDKVIIVCPYIGEDDLQELSKESEKYIERSFMPELHLEEADTEKYLMGLISIGLEGVNRPLRIIR